jgi:hypothetical protein
MQRGKLGLEPKVPSRVASDVSSAAGAMTVLVKGTTAMGESEKWV